MSSADGFCGSTPLGEDESLLDRRVSLFRGVHDTRKGEVISIRELLGGWRAGAWAESVQGVRRLFVANNVAEAKAEKSKLMCVTLSGEVIDGPLKGAAQDGRFRHVGLMQIDLDGEDNPGWSPAEMKAALKHLPFIVAVSFSPRGNGVKGLARIVANVESHVGCFEAARRILAEKGLKLDPATKNPTRLCFVTFDPSIWIRGGETEVLKPFNGCDAEEIDSPQMGGCASAAGHEPEEDGAQQLTDHEILKMGRSIPRQPHAIWIKLVSAVLHAVRYDKTRALRLLKECWSEEVPGEYEKLLQAPLRRVRTGTFVYYAKKYGYGQSGHGSAESVGKGEEEGDQPCAADSSECQGDAARDLPPGPLPLVSLPPVAKDMAQHIAAVTTSQNQNLAAAAVLGVLSASMGAGVEVVSGGERRTKGNLFILAIAESGTGKSEAYRLAAAPFDDLEREVIEAFEKHEKPGLIAKMNVSSARAESLRKKAVASCEGGGALFEAYQKAEEDREAVQRQVEAAPRWRVADATKEALSAIMQGQQGEALASMSSEARGILSIVGGRYSKEGGDEDFYCSAYSGDSITVDRVNRPRIVLRKPCLSVLWMIQPDAARKILGEEAMTVSGLLPRFLLFDGKAEPVERSIQVPPIPDEVKAKWAALIEELIHNFRQRDGLPVQVVPSTGAAGVFAEYENENIRRRQQSGDLRDLASYVARWAENAWRIALVLHCATHGGRSGEEVLSEETARDAVVLMRWFAGCQLEVLSAARTSGLRRRLSALLTLLAEAGGEITLRVLARSHSFSQEEVEQLQAHFPEEVRVEKRTTGGRPSWVVSKCQKRQK